MRKKNRRKKKKNIASKSIICITTIAMLNVMGISYGEWSERTRTKAKISTGNIDPCFIGSMNISENQEEDTIMYEVEGENGEKVTQNFNYKIQDELNISKKSKKETTITGSVINSSSHTVEVNVKNHGTIPIELDYIDNGECSEKIIIEPKCNKTFEINNVYIEPSTENEDIILKFKQSI